MRVSPAANDNEGELFLLGLGSYLYLPIRAAMDSPMDANNPTNFERFLQAAVEVVLGYEFFERDAFERREVALLGTHHGLTSG